MVTCLAMFSGGLDSFLAIKLVQEQNINVIALYFDNPFDSGKVDWPEIIAKKLKVKLVRVKLGKDYLNLVKKPKYGYGSAVNPCVDCRIFLLKKAKKLMKKYNADFIITGEVLGQRPMSQHRKAMDLVEKESMLKGNLLRPLTAKNLEETSVEKKGLVDRSKLLGISGRSRKIQLEMAKKYGIEKFATPAGGCLLTDKNYATKLIDLFKNGKLDERNIRLLNVGRHFRKGKTKIIVGRNHEENLVLEKLKGKDVLLKPIDVPGPSVLVQGKDLDVGARILVYYCKAKAAVVKIDKKEKKFEEISSKELEKYKIKN